MELLSHPDKSLIIHLTEVADIAVESINRKILNFSIDFEGNEIDISELVIDLIYFAAAFHDLGKATSFFQHYIKNLNEEHDKRKSHALLSALFVYYVSDKFTKSNNVESELAQLLSIFTFSAVKRHHGRLGNLSEEILIDEQWRELMPELIESVNEVEVQECINILLSEYDLNIKWR